MFFCPIFWSAQKPDFSRRDAVTSICSFQLSMATLLDGHPFRPSIHIIHLYKEKTITKKIEDNGTLRSEVRSFWKINLTLATGTTKIVHSSVHFNE